MDTTGINRQLNNISKKTHNEIWMFTEGKYKSSPLETYQDKTFLNVYIDKKYFNFLNDYSKTEKDLLKYVKTTKALGGIGPTAITDFLFNYENLILIRKLFD